MAILLHHQATSPYMKYNLKTKCKKINKMRTEIQKILNIRNFFKIIQSTDKNTKYSIQRPSRLLLHNIHVEWLQSIWSKTHRNFPVYLNESKIEQPKEPPFGFINQNTCQLHQQQVWEHNLKDDTTIGKCELKFNIIVPEQDIMQYFIQWQRYRKYWWSSITTTPSLFGLDDIKYGDGTADVNIVANFPWGQQTVERITINSKYMSFTKSSHLSCVISLENALFTLLLDGLTNITKERYLRLHKKMAPYKISFALDNQAPSIQALNELAKLLFHKLDSNKISSLLPDFTLSLESQLKENLAMGVVYTAILSEKTLTTGIFHLMNSSTMLKEEVHVSDFHHYSKTICR